jgi:hypothetical protein
MDNASLTETYICWNYRGPTETRTILLNAQECTETYWHLVYPSLALLMFGTKSLPLLEEMFGLPYCQVNVRADAGFLDHARERCLPWEIWHPIFTENEYTLEDWYYDKAAEYDEDIFPAHCWE